MALETKDQVRELVELPLMQEGFELADIVLSRYRTQVTLRLFVYGKHGVSLADCAHLTKVIGNIIDETKLFESGYTFEVSSPGLDRPLKTARDFAYRIGETVTVQFVDPKRKKLTAKLVGVSESTVELDDEGQTIMLDLADIAQAKIVF